MFADPEFDLPPPPVLVLAQRPEYIVDPPPPPAPEDMFVLPTPVYAPLPLWVDRPSYVAPPPVNIVAYNIHNTVIVNQDTVVVKDPAGNPVSPLANAAAVGALPPSMALLPAKAGPSRPPHVQAGQPAHLAPNPAGAGALVTGGATLPAAGVLRVALPPSVAARAQRAAERASGAPLGAPRAGAAPNANGQPTAKPLLPLPQLQQQKAQELQQQRAPQIQQQQKAQELQQRRAPQIQQQQSAQQIQQQRVQQLQQQRAGADAKPAAASGSWDSPRLWEARLATMQINVRGLFGVCVTDWAYPTAECLWPILATTEGMAAPVRNLRVQSKPAFSRFPPAHWVDLEGQQRVELSHWELGR